MHHILTNDTLTLFDHGKHMSFNRAASESTWEKALHFLKIGAYDELKKLFDVASRVNEYFDGIIRVRDGVVYYRDKPVESYVARKAVSFMQNDLPYKPLLKFIGNLQENPSYRATQDLYQFLEYGQMPITEDGCFMAYKKVMRDGDTGKLVDIYTRTISNDIGKTVEVPRNQVDKNPDHTCSFGLHVCSFDYLPHFGTGPYHAVVAVKVNPKDVVAIPRDYNNTKMRVCRYEVVEEVTNYSEHVWHGIDLYHTEPDEFAELEEELFEDPEDPCDTPTAWRAH